MHKKKNEQKLTTYMFKISGAGLFVLEVFSARSLNDDKTRYIHESGPKIAILETSPLTC